MIDPDVKEGRTMPTTDGRAHIDAAIHRMIQHIVDDIATDARDHAPVESGELRASISSEASGATGRVIAASDHAIYVELGTENMPAQPFLRPALYKNRQVHS